MESKFALCLVFHAIVFAEVRCLQESNRFDHSNNLQPVGEGRGSSATPTAVDVDTEGDDDYSDRLFEGSGRGEVAVRAAYTADDERYDTDASTSSDDMNIDSITTHTPEKPPVITYDVGRYVANAVSKLALMVVKFISSPVAVHSFFNDPVDLKDVPVAARADFRFVELFVRSVNDENFLCLQRFSCQFPYQATRYLYALKGMLNVVERSESQGSSKLFHDIVATIEAASKYGHLRSFKMCDMKFPCKCGGRSCY